MNLLNFMIITILNLNGMLVTYTPVSVMIAKEYQIKSVFLYNFTKGFITWPASVFANDNETFNLCVLGEEQLTDVLNTTMQGKTSKEGRSLVINKLQNIFAISACQILFIDKSQQDSFPQIRQLAIRHSTLTVSDMKDFTEKGGMIEFFTVDNKLKLAINICVLEQAKIKATANLLQLSKITRECPD